MVQGPSVKLHDTCACGDRAESMHEGNWLCTPCFAAAIDKQSKNPQTLRESMDALMELSECPGAQNENRRVQMETLARLVDSLEARGEDDKESTANAEKKYERAKAAYRKWFKSEILVFGWCFFLCAALILRGSVFSDLFSLVLGSMNLNLLIGHLKKGEDK